MSADRLLQPHGSPFAATACRSTCASTTSSSVSCPFPVRKPPRSFYLCCSCITSGPSRGTRSCLSSLHCGASSQSGRTNALATMRPSRSWKSSRSQLDAASVFEGFQNDAKDVRLQDARSPDLWMKEVVCDIVKNINEAPFVHILFDSDVNGTATLSQRHRVDLSQGENDVVNAEVAWKDAKDCVNNASADGMILVRHLEDESVLDDLGSPIEIEAKVNETGSCEEKANQGNGSCGRTCLWGILVLGKTVTRSACYILKTTSVASSFGTITGFCLTKAKCFGPSWHDQMQKSWLLAAEKPQQDYR